VDALTQVAWFDRWWKWRDSYEVFERLGTFLIDKGKTYVEL